MKDKIKTSKQEATNVVKNLMEFLEAAALGLVSVFAIHTGIYQYHLQDAFAWALALGGGLVVIQAALLLVRHFNKK